MSETSHSNLTDVELDNHYVQNAAELLKSSAIHQRALLSVLAVADRFGIDPVLMVRSLADELPASYRTSASQLADQIEQGVDPVDALAKSPDLLPSASVLALGLARDHGTLGALYDSLLSRDVANESDIPGLEEDYVSKIARLLLRFFVVAFLLTFLMIKVVPEFLSMFEEFGVAPPTSLILLVLTSDYIAKFWFLGVLLMMVMTAFCFPVLTQYLRTWNPLVWRQKSIHPSVNRRQELALIAEADQSLDSGLEMILEHEPNSRSLKQLRRAKGRIENGQEQWGALATEKVIPRHDAEAMRLSDRGETQAWLLRWSAATQLNRRTTRSVFIAQTIVFLVNVALGILVALACVAVFMTLINIMNSLH